MEIGDGLLAIRYRLWVMGYGNGTNNTSRGEVLFVYGQEVSDCTLSCFTKATIDYFTSSMIK